MEAAVPGRGPAGSAYRYTWDARGDVRKIEKMSKRPLRNPTTSSSGRTIPWPFQSTSIRPNSLSSTIPLSTSHPSARRRSAPWSSAVRPVSSMLDLDVVPDYVVNFLRGETPETMAQKRERRERFGARSPRFGHARNEVSCTADIYFAGTADTSVMGEKGRNASARQVVGLMTGWRGGVVLNVLLALLILVPAIVCLVLAATSARMLGGESELLKGKCSKIQAVDRGIHAAVNVLGFVVVVGANYVFQVLTSPTREEVDSAHAKQQWLDIGVPSLRSLKGVSKGRAVLAVVILLAAVSSQLIYNSITFTSQASNSNTCTLTLNGSLLGVVTILNLISVLALALALIRRPSFDPLVTLGDAIASFLTRPDSTTRGACLLTKDDVRTRDWKIDGARRWAPEGHRWGQSPSAARWIVWAVSWAVPVVLAAVGLAKTLTDRSEDAFSSFGRANSTYPFSFTAPRAAYAIIIALPHLLLAILYLTTNSLLTVFYLSHELSLFAIPGKAIPLRVSSGEPLGAQTTSLYLTLPRPFSWLLFVVFAGAGFVLSQAVSLTITPSGAAMGLSPLPLIVLLGLLLLVGVLVGGLSLRRAGNASEGEGHGNPLALKGGSCSAVLSARCHRSDAEGEEMVMGPLAWGVIREGTPLEPGHATFSGGPLGMINADGGYA